MSDIVRIPHYRDLTRLLSGLPLARRVAARRRIELIADHWELYLIHKYGRDRAVFVCRHKMIFCLKHTDGIRSVIWTKVYLRLRRPEDRRSNHKVR